MKNISWQEKQDADLRGECNQGSAGALLFIAAVIILAVVAVLHFLK